MNNIVKIDFMRPETGHAKLANARLRTALASLLEANSNAQISVQKFRKNMKKLEDKMDELGRNCKIFQQKMGQVKTKPLIRKSRRLARIMEGWLEQNTAK